VDSGVTLAAWCFATVGHFLLTARWVNRADQSLTRDERWFRTMVAGIAGLSIVLHFLAAASALTLTRAIVILAAGHGLMAWRLAGRTSSAAAPPDTDRITRALEFAAILTLVAVVMQWTLIGVPTLEVSGTDAAHYHVPNAVNLALGSSLFGLPPTPHLYPMGSSMLAAWFILPLHTTLLTDLVMVLPFLLLVSSVGYLFRQLTGLSGLAWATWATLALCSTRLFRYAGLMSADLFFAASSVALAAALLAPMIRRRLTSMDVWLIAMSTGLLIGTKVTGVPVAGLLGLPAVVALVIQRFRGRTTPALAHERLTARVWVGATMAMVGAGGIWLVRNWWVWDSLFPGATVGATMYLSVLGDMTETSNYDLWARTRHFAGIWLSPWYLVVIAGMLLVPLDAVVGRLRGAPSSLAQPRFWSFTVIAVTGAVLTWVLIGAPWTSLEWTRGLSLRYAMPWLVFLPLVTWVGLFPTSLPWYRRAPLAAVAGIVIAGGGLMILAGRTDPPFPPLPTVRAALAALVVWVILLAATSRSRAMSAVAAVVVLAGSIGFGVWARDANARGAEERAAAMSDWPQTDEERVYAAALRSEARDGVTCAAGRRFFATTRFNLPMALQDVRLSNFVYYAARDLKVTATVRPAMGPCDYIITDAGVMDTIKGANLHAALSGSATLSEAARIDRIRLLVRR
jgi:hypothetical protein